MCQQLGGSQHTTYLDMQRKITAPGPDSLFFLDLMRIVMSQAECVICSLSSSVARIFYYGTAAQPPHPPPPAAASVAPNWGTSHTAFGLIWCVTTGRYGTF